jgi:radical SAM superfamily enzyme YgiQ (UPF0313 family)
MDVLLINPPIRLEWKPNLEPLGLGYIAQSLLDEGHTVRTFDIQGYRWSNEEVERKIGELDYDVVGIGGIITAYKYIKWLTPLLKKHNPTAKIIIGGGVGSAVPRLVLENSDADICVIGEGEITIKELVRALKDSTDLASVNGIWFKENGKIYPTPPREPIKNLDALPFPNRDLFPIDIYIENPIEPLEGRSLTISATRGCPYHCNFCYNIDGRHVRMRSADSIIQEIKLLKEKYGVEVIQMVDNTFMVSKKRVYEFCEKLIEQDIDIKWMCTGRAELVDEDILRKMKSAGCAFLSIGIESGSQKMLDSMKKGTTVEQNKRAVRMIRKAGIGVNTPFMIGTAGETRETIRETIEFCKELRIWPTLFITTPYPDSPLYQEVKRMGKIPDEDKYVEQLGDAGKVTVNLTELSDDELMRLKDEAEREIRQNITIFDEIREYYGMNGFINLLKRGMGRIYEKLKKK